MFFGSGIWGLIFVKSRILVFHRVFSWSKILGLSIPRSIQLVLRSRGLAAYWRSSSERRSTFSASNRLTNIQIWPPHQQTPAILVHVLNTKIQHSKIQIEKQIQIWSFKWTLAQQSHCIYVLCQKIEVHEFHVVPYIFVNIKLSLNCASSESVTLATFSVKLKEKGRFSVIRWWGSYD